MNGNISKDFLANMNFYGNATVNIQASGNDEVNGKRQMLKIGVKEKIEVDLNEFRQLINKFLDPNLRDTVLEEISERVNNLPQFGVQLWSAFGTVPAMLSELISLYPAIECPTIIQERWTRALSTLNLLKGLASNPDTREQFAQAYIPAYILPLLYNVDPSVTLLEKLRLQALEVIKNLLQGKESAIIDTLLTIDIIPICLKLVNDGSLLTKQLSLSIFERVISSEQGLWYICHTPERVEHVITTFNKILASTKNTFRMNFKETLEMIKAIIFTYTRLLETEYGRLYLIANLPSCLSEKPFIEHFYNEITNIVVRLRKR